MFCPHCGQPVAESATFCGTCGKPLVEGVRREMEGYHAGKELATFWPRLGALLIDGLVIGFAAGVFGLVTIGAAIAMTPTGEDSSGAAVALMVVGFVGVIVLVVSLTWRFNARGTGPGARAMHVRIVDKNGDPPGVGRGLGRMLVASFLSGNLFNLGYLWAIWDREHRTWHDHLAGTWVVRGE
ncbi:MAG: zinc-ribbon domain-containing protein [Dehalococcoidia bacterium]|nr:MAG: zinc-ribbon domain-containing protein [Dehalococcoidia bacterium]